MGEAADRVSADSDPPHEKAQAIDEELDDLRHELSMLVDELDRRREALDPRVQLRRHPLTGVLAGGLIGVVGGLAIFVARRRRRPRGSDLSLEEEGAGVRAETHDETAIQ